MLVLAWLGLAHAAETDCVTKDLAWRWLNTTDGAKPGDRWVHGSKVVVEQAPGASGRLTWKADESTKVPFKTSHDAGNTQETFKWTVTLTATDGKPIGGDVPEAEVKLTMHCLRTTEGGGGTPRDVSGAKPSKAAGAAAATKAEPAPAPAPAAPAPKPAPAPAPKP